MGNEFSNIFSYNNFFEESDILLENGEKNFGGIDIRNRNLTPKINITFFIANQIRC